jgi:hypothetical protein
MPESEYLRREAENHPDEPEYLNDLRILRRFVQEGSFGYRQSRDIVFQTLKARYSESYSAFGEERRRETLESGITSVSWTGSIYATATPFIVASS